MVQGEGCEKSDVGRHRVQAESSEDREQVVRLDLQSPSDHDLSRLRTRPESEKDLREASSREAIRGRLQTRSISHTGGGGKTSPGHPVKSFVGAP